MKINKLRPLVDKMRHWPWDGTPPLGIRPETETAIRLVCAYCTALDEFRDLSVGLGLADFPKSNKASRTLRTGFAAPDGMGLSYVYTTVDLTTQIAQLAQHHGVPTFLLDWTKRPEVAAQFAASDNNLPPGSSDIAVFALRFENEFFPDPSHGHPSGSMLFRVIEDAPINNRFLAAQHGIFTRSEGIKEFYETGEFPALEETLAKIDVPKSILLKITLKLSEVPKLRELLDREELSDAHLKPTLDNVANTIKARWILP